jgi:hypothetical protein
MTVKKLRNSRIVLVIFSIILIIMAIAEAGGDGTALMVGLICAFLVILISIPTKSQS